jgi:UDP-GlcNAc:undecaprenyl-phosphate GlcNAc-1-phosphate transferase
MGWMGIPLSVLWIVGVTNAVNFIDGLDGLAAGISGIVATVIFAALMTHGRGYPELAFVSVALAGACFGFLRYNFFPAKIFMGDSGSLFLGFVLASLALWGNRKSTVAITLLVPVIVLGIPILDAFLAVMRRIKNGTHLFKADKKHIHHWLLNTVKDQRTAVLILYLITLVLGYVAVTM